MIEIERKFLLVSDDWRSQVSHASHLEQGYFSSGKGYNLRSRIVDGKEAFLTIKAQGANPVSKLEFEYPIPVADAKIMLGCFCLGRTLSKTRHFLDFGGFTWEIDEFEGANAGLIVAEIELPSPDTDFPRPAWLGEEVTADFRYRNSNLVRVPFSTWDNNNQQPN